MSVTWWEVRPTSLMAPECWIRAADHSLLEAHLLDFDGDLYQQRLELRFVARLRDELKYPDARALSEQIGRDVEATRAVLNRTVQHPLR